MPVHNAAREQQVLNQVSLQAQKLGYPPQIIQAIFKVILLEANKYEASNSR